MHLRPSAFEIYLQFLFVNSLSFLHSLPFVVVFLDELVLENEEDLQAEVRQIGHD